MELVFNGLKYDNIIKYSILVYKKGAMKLWDKQY